MPGIPSTPSAGTRILRVEVSDETVSVELADGRSLSVPLSWYPRLAHASPAERGHWMISAGGFGVRWPDIDEDLHVDGLLRGARSPELRS